MKILLSLICLSLSSCDDGCCASLARERERSRQLEKALIQLQDEVLTNNLPPTMKQTK